MERYPNFRGQALLFLLFLWFIWFINFSVRMVFSPILPIIEDEFMVNHARASSIFIFLSTGYAVGVIVSGLFSGKVGYKKSIVLALALISLVSFLIPLVHNFLLLYLFAFVVGFSVGLYVPSVIPLITEYYAEKNWGKAIAIHDTGAAAGILATPSYCPLPSPLFTLARHICGLCVCLSGLLSCFSFCKHRGKNQQSPQSNIPGYC